MKKTLSKLTPAPYTTGYWVTLTFSIIIFSAGFICPPIGHIDGTVLIAVGIIAIYHLAYTAIKGNRPVTLKLDADDHSLSLSTHAPQNQDPDDHPATDQ